MYKSMVCLSVQGESKKGEAMSQLVEPDFKTDRMSERNKPMVEPDSPRKLLVKDVLSFPGPFHVKMSYVQS